MKCPYCSNKDSSVIDTRTLENNTIKRRRSCDTCKRKFSTLESIFNLDLKVIKKKINEEGDFIKECFSVEKIKKSIEIAAGKKANKELVNQIIQSSIDKVLSKKTNEINSSRIGDIVLEEISKISPSAYLRFACEYMGLKSIEEAKDLIEKYKESRNSSIL